MDAATLIHWPDPAEAGHVFEMTVEDVRDAIVLAGRDLDAAVDEAERDAAIGVAAFWQALLLSAELEEFASGPKPLDMPLLISAPAHGPSVELRRFMERFTEQEDL